MKRPYDRTRFFTRKLLALSWLMWFAVAASALITGTVATIVFALLGRELSWVGGQIVLGIGAIIGFALYMRFVLRPAARERRRLLENEWAATHPADHFGQRS